MTALGKTLAIVNLVLSLVVGAFIVMTYVARTNWHARYVEMASQAKVSQDDAAAFKKEMDLAKSEKAQAEELKAKTKEAADEQQKKLTSQIDDLAEKLKRASQEIGEHVAAQNAAGEELKRRASEADYLKTLVAARDEELKKREKQNQDMRDAMVEATINYNAERERNGRLLQENERLTKDNRQMQQTATSTSLRSEAPKKNPPADDIEGLVKATDSRSGYVTVSVGSDAGLSKGNTLEVFRTKPEPAYLGTIQILAVLAKEAVGKPIEPRGRGVIQVGDQVSSSIVRRH